MKIVYNPTMLQQIRNIIPLIDKERDLKGIEVTPAEMRILAKELRERDNSYIPEDGVSHVIVDGIDIRRGTR
jgi:hypothetical protein